MKKLTITVLLTVVFVLPKITEAQQISSQITGNYSTSVTQKVYVIASKVNLSDASQVWLANKYLQQDSSINSLILQNADALVIKKFTDSTDKLIINGLKSVVSNSEKQALLQYLHSLNPEILIINGHSTEGVDLTTQFGIALRKSAQLQLNDNQIVQLIEQGIIYSQKLKYIKNNPDSGNFNPHVFEIDKMQQILTELQYSNMLDIKNKQQATKKANADWDELVKKGLNNLYNRDTVLFQAKKYHLKQLAVLDKYFHIDRKIAANETRKLEKEMPEALKLLSANDIDNNYKSQFGFALKYKKELQLNQQQVLQLLDKAKDYESKMQFARKHPDSGYFDSHKFESINMTSILTLSKYEQLLAYKNKDKAVEQAGYTWYELTKKGLSSGLNKDSTIGTISQYYTLTYSIIDMYAHDIDARKRALKAIDAQMPAALVLIKKSKSNGNAGQYVW
jgi:hypothetical protein